MEAIQNDGSLWAWGSGALGRLYNGYSFPPPMNTPPVKVNENPAAKWKTVAAAFSSTFGIQEDGTLWGWGADTDYRAGQISPFYNRAVPAQIGSDIDWDTVSAAHSFAIALKKDGSLWGWGNNQFGQFGDTFYTKDPYAHGIFPHPIQIGADTDWKYISAGVGSIFAIKKDGTMWSWGSGSIPNTPAAKHFNPIQVGTDTDWESVSAGAFHYLALKKNGTLWAWGQNGYGQLGVGSILINNATIVQVGTDSDWKSIFAGDNHNAALKTNGTLWTWGENTIGQLGKGFFSNSMDESNKTPAQVGNATNWIYVSAGAENTAGIQSDGTLSTWGNNSYQQLGREPFGTQGWSTPGSVTCDEPIPPTANCGISSIHTNTQSSEVCKYQQSINLAPQFQDMLFTYVSNVSIIQWTSSGTGTFLQGSSIITDYVFSDADRANGSVEFTVVANGLNCSNMTATKTITINDNPTIEPISNQKICGDSVVIHAAVSNTDKVYWGSSGTGTFASHVENVDSATYYPSAGDMANGNININVFVSQDNCPISLGQSSSINFLNSIHAGLDQTICEGSSLELEGSTIKNVSGYEWHTNGTGTFAPDNTFANPTYTPSAADISTGKAILTLSAAENQGCPAVSDEMILNFRSNSLVVTADAGIDQTICGNAVTLSGTVQNASGGSWSTNGTGIFTPGAHYLNTTYVFSAADLTNKTVNFTLIATGTCGPGTTDDITVNATPASIAPTVNAGPDLSILENQSVTLYGYSTSSSNVYWSSTGTGVFSNTATTYTIYTPSAEDITKGWVELILTTVGNGSCTPTQDRMYLAIGTTYAIRGFVYAGANLLDIGKANLFKQTGNGLTFIQETQVANGRFAFNQLPPGTYYVQCYPSQNSIFKNSFLATFSGGHANWNYYESIVVGSIDMAYILSLTPVTASNTLWHTGTDTIAGTVFITNQTPTFTGTIGKPAAYATVLLTDAQGDTLSSTQTGADGRFMFPNVQSGDYKLLVYSLGYKLANNQSYIRVSVDGNGVTIEDASMQLEKQTLITGLTSATNAHTLRVYPNPAHTTISINMDGILNGDGTIIIMDETGVIKLQQNADFNSPIITLSIDALPAGIYMIHISSEENTYLSKVVKF